MAKNQQPAPAADRVWVEAWSPEYGASFDAAGGLSQSEESVDPYVEETDWRPCTPEPSEWRETAFLDGVSRVDARAFLDAGPITVPGICGSVGIGAVIVDGRATFGPCEVHRAAIFGSGASAEMPVIGGGLEYKTRSVPGIAQDDVRKGLETFRGEVEARLAADLARSGLLVLADGALGVRESLPVIGFIKSHARAYLPPDLEPVVRSLKTGQRTPVFLFGEIRPRYSWYLRLAESEGQHPWAAIVRCEVPASVSMAESAELADFTAFHLPRFASKGHWDTRAPQNLVPIASLERKLWHLLGDRELVYRKIRSALMLTRGEDV